jgi:hypothetical protein
MKGIGLMGIVLSLLMCSCVPYITLEATDDLTAEEYSATGVSPATLDEIQSFLKEDRVECFYQMSMIARISLLTCGAVPI